MVLTQSCLSNAPIRAEVLAPLHVFYGGAFRLMAGRIGSNDAIPLGFASSVSNESDAMFPPDDMLLNDSFPHVLAMSCCNRRGSARPILKSVCFSVVALRAFQVRRRDCTWRASRGSADTTPKTALSEVCRLTPKILLGCDWSNVLCSLSITRGYFAAVPIIVLVPHTQSYVLDCQAFPSREEGMDKICMRLSGSTVSLRKKINGRLGRRLVDASRLTGVYGVVASFCQTGET